MGVSLQGVLTCSKQGTNAGNITGVKVNNVQVAQAGFGEDNTGNHQNGACDQGTDGVGENVLEHDPAVSCAQGAGNENIFLILKPVELHSGTASHACPTC